MTEGFEVRKCPACGHGLNLVERKVMPGFFNEVQTAWFFYCPRCQKAAAVPDAWIKAELGEVAFNA